MFVLVIFISILGGCSQNILSTQSKINPYTGDEFKNADLPFYSCEGDSETVETILNLGLDYQMDAALECAVDSGSLETLKLLIDAGANIDYENQLGENLLLLAIKYSNLNLVFYLIEQGVDINVVNKRGENLLTYLFPNESTFSISDQTYFDILIALNEKGMPITDIEVQTMEKNSVPAPLLAHAITNLNPELMEQLLALGSTIDLTNKQQYKAITGIQLEIHTGSTRTAQLIACILGSNTNVPVELMYGNMGQERIFLPDCPRLLNEYDSQYIDSDSNISVDDSNVSDNEAAVSVSKSNELVNTGNLFIKSKAMNQLIADHPFVKAGILADDNFEQAKSKSGASSGEGYNNGGLCAYFDSYYVCISEFEPETLSAVELKINDPLTVQQLNAAIGKNLDITSDDYLGEDYISTYKVDGQEFMFTYTGDQQHSLITNIFIKN